LDLSRQENEKESKIIGFRLANYFPSIPKSQLHENKDSKSLHPNTFSISPDSEHFKSDLSQQFRIIPEKAYFLQVSSR